MTASEPTDLIRSVDQHHQACCPDVTEGCGCLGCGQEWPCEVRRLRDALEASEFDRAVALDAAERLRRDAASASAALAEANATIQRVKAVLDRSSRLVHLDHFIRRAIEGPAT